MRLISVVTPCFNEQDNVEEMYRQVKQVFDNLPQYQYEHIFIDNASTDKTPVLLKALAARDNNVKVIINTRNFGHIRSPYYAILQARGEAVIGLASDLQDPPGLIPDFLAKWEAGYNIVVGVKESSEENFLMSLVRRSYYRLVTKIAEIDLIKNFTGFGLYDREVVEILRNMNETYPYFRGLISEIGFPIATVGYQQPRRKRGITKNNFYSLYDMAMLGITSHSKLPIRLATIGGFTLSVISFCFAAFFLVMKLLFWYHYPAGITPILIGMFFFASIQLFFIGILGEYVLSIHQYTQKRPLVIERERINFSCYQECEQAS